MKQLESCESSLFVDITTAGLSPFASAAITSEKRLGAALEINGKSEKYGDKIWVFMRPDLDDWGGAGVGSIS